jgi:hypothetical protein
MCVFESDGPNLALTIAGRSTILNPGDIVWIFNLPLLQVGDSTPNEIEHISEWTQFVDPPLSFGTLSATTNSVLVPAAVGGRFEHPCLSLPGARKAAEDYHRKIHLNQHVGGCEGDEGAVAAGIPPDCDLCMQFRS